MASTRDTASLSEPSGRPLDAVAVAAAAFQPVGHYDNAYYPDNVYGHIAALIEQVKVRAGGLHLDFGCGYGRIAEKLSVDLGLTYVGFDHDQASLQSLRQRGFEAVPTDLQNFDGLRATVTAAVAGRKISSISIIDTLEHLAEPERLLCLVHELAGSVQAPLFISVPNVGHWNVGFKLAFGQWDYTPTGILDHTHLRCFTEQGLKRLTLGSYWREIGSNDVKVEKTDQFFPAFHPALAEGTLLHRLLKQLRESADGMATTQQLVRAYLPGPVLGKFAFEVPQPAPRAPFLTVLTRTQGRRLDTLRDVLLCLSAQTDQDFEVIVVGHRLDVPKQLAVERLIDDTREELRSRIRLIRIDHGNRTTPLNEGFAEARGDYVAILDDDDVVFGHWVETFKSLAATHPGRVLRTGPVTQISEPVHTADGSSSVRAVSGFDRYPLAFDLLEHLVVNKSPPVCLAFPRSAFADMKIRFDETLSTTEDWDFLMRTVAICNVADSPRVTGIYRQWRNAESSFTVHGQAEWEENHKVIWRKLDRVPFILPEGSASRIRALYTQVPHPHELSPVPEREDHARALRARAQVLLTSRSWKLTAPLRAWERLQGRQAPDESARFWEMGIPDLEAFVKTLEESASWRLSGHVREAKRRLKGALG